MNSVHTVTHYFFKIHLNIILASMFMSSRWSLPFRHSDENSVSISHFSYAFYMPSTEVSCLWMWESCRKCRLLCQPYRYQFLLQLLLRVPCGEMVRSARAGRFWCRYISCISYVYFYGKRMWIFQRWLWEKHKVEHMTNFIFYWDILGFPKFLFPRFACLLFTFSEVFIGIS